MKIVDTAEIKANQNIFQTPNADIVKDKLKENIEQTTEKENELGVTLDISEQAIEMLKQQAENAKKQGDAVADLAKYMEIARRISNGDKVPASDERKLMEYSFELYQAAKSAGSMSKNDDPEEYDAIFEEEEDGVTREKLRELKQVSESRDKERGGE